MVTTAFPKRRGNRPTPAGDIPEDVILDTVYSQSVADNIDYY
jgi:hypothetical protein